MPAYISWVGHGGAVGSPPGVFTGAHARVFAFDIDRGAAQELVDKLLGPAASVGTHYRVIGPFAFVSFVDVARCAQAADSPGWVPGRECAIWLPMWEEKPFSLGRLVLWTPYIFINYSVGMATGREVWGWAKVGATIQLPGDDPANRTSFACRTLLFREFDPDRQGLQEALLTVTGDRPVDGALSEWASPEDFLKAISPLFAAVAEVGVNLFPPDLPAIALKQFPESDNPTQACYQAIVNSPCRLTRFDGGGMIDGNLVLDVANCMSHQIITDLLGVPPKTSGSTRLPVAWAAWIKFEFEALGGSKV